MAVLPLTGLPNPRHALRFRRVPQTFFTTPGPASKMVRPLLQASLLVTDQGTRIKKGSVKRKGLYAKLRLCSFPWLPVEYTLLGVAKPTRWKKSE